MLLRIADNLELPYEAVTQTIAILGMRGSGKTTTGVVLTEEMVKPGLPVVVFDPVGVWWGLRASADGKGIGLPVLIAGGYQGDVPLSAEAGEALARLVVEELVPQRRSLVLDLSALGNAGMIRFMGDFAEALYQLKAAHREALHLVLDEADLFVPQRSGRGEERVLRAFDDIVRRGRTRGLGTTLITQRPAAINKNVLTQAEMLVALRMTSPQDRSAVDDWVKAHGTPEQRDQMMSSLPSLPVGTAWAWSPGWLGVFERIKVRRRETFDSSSTPKVGERIEVPTALADAELAALRDRFAAAVTEVEPNNPDDLRRELRQLRAQVVRHRPSEAFRTVEKRVEVPVLQPDQLTALQNAVDALTQALEPVVAALSRIERAGPPVSKETDTSAAPERALTEDGIMRLPERLAKIVGLLAGNDGLTRTQLALVTGAQEGSSTTLGRDLGELKLRGLVETSNEKASLTKLGRAYASSPGLVAKIVNSHDLITALREAVSLPERRMLDALVDAYPDRLTAKDIMIRAGYSSPNGKLYQQLNHLLKTGLAAQGDGLLWASDTLFPDSADK